MVLALSLLAALGGCASNVPLSIRVVKNRLVDGRGQPVRLLGVNRSGSEYACIQGLSVFAGPTDARSIAAMASWRINAVRVPLNEQCWLGINGIAPRYSGRHYRRTIRAYVARLHRAGLYVILDLHWNAPGRARATAQQPMADLDHAPAFWSSVARTFKHDKAVVFELYNEPRGVSWRCWRSGCRLHEGWRTAGMQKLVDAVRSTGARQPVIATGLASGSDVSAWLRYRPHDRVHQLVAGFHAYLGLPCDTLSCWEEKVRPVKQRFPLVTTELGERDCQHAFIDRFMSWADGRAVSYLGWSWNPSGCSYPGLIAAWNGQPTPYGEGFRAHLMIKR